jgi:hypothetical protein
MTFALPRPPSVALREYVPGNLIYANGNRFVARRFHRNADEQSAEMPVFEVVVERQAVKPTNLAAATTGLGHQVLQANSRSAMSTLFISRTSPTTKSCASSCLWRSLASNANSTTADVPSTGASSLCTCAVVCVFGLVNVGATRAIERSGRFGYPVSHRSGRSVSPLSSDTQHEQFENTHEERCGRRVLPHRFLRRRGGRCADATGLP